MLEADGVISAEPVEEFDGRSLFEETTWRVRLVFFRDGSDVSRLEVLWEHSGRSPPAGECDEGAVRQRPRVRQRDAIGGFILPDPTTMAVTLDPSIATDVRRVHVDIEEASELCRGQTVVDHVGVTGQTPNTDVVMEIDRQRFIDLLRRSIS